MRDPGISWDIPYRYYSIHVGISRDTSTLISGISRDIPVSAYFESVLPGYPHVFMLKIDLDKLMEALFFIRGGGPA